MVGALRRRARPVVGVRRDEEAHAHAAAGGLLDAPDHSLVRDVRVHDVERLARNPRAGRPIAAVIGRYRRVVQDVAGTRLVRASCSGKSVSRSCATDHRQPREARHEDELELRDDGAGDAHEEIVEAAVLEVILDAGAPDPADPAVDDDQLAMVDVPELVKVPLARCSRRVRLRRRS